MKKTSTLILFALFGFASAWAQEFKAVSPSGDTLYYTILDKSHHTVGVVTASATTKGALVIPETVTYQGIGYSVIAIEIVAFRGFTGITSVNIPNTVTAIGDGAFAFCGSLTSVVIPHSVTYLGEEVFYHCDHLESVTLSNAITYIQSGTFAQCGILTVTIPDAVSAIEEDAFEGVRHIIYHGSASGAPWGALTINGEEE